LIEVVLAIGVVAFAFIPMIGLLPVGLSTFRQSIEATVGSQIVEGIINEAQQTDFTTLTNQTNALSYYYYDEQGNKLTSQAGSVYTAQVIVNAPTSLPNATAGPSSNLATLTVRFAHNPGHSPLTGPNAVPSTAYSALIARNL
jgi:uncharacterized protein (TIGR02598 family)